LGLSALYTGFGTYRISKSQSEYIEGQSLCKGNAWNMYQSLYKEGRLGIFPRDMEAKQMIEEKCNV